MNLVWIENVRRAFGALYGEKRGPAVCGAVIPGIMADFRKELQNAPEGSPVTETYRLDDRRGDVIAAGYRRGAALYLTGLSVGGVPVDLGASELPL